MAVTGVLTTQLAFPPEPRTAARARRAVREALLEAGAADLRPPAELAVSELVTNAVVHAGTEVRLRIVATADAIRVEIEDGDGHLPVRCTWSTAAATGRGLQIVEAHVDRWDAVRTESGKVVWFEIGHLRGQPRPADDPVPEAEPEAVDVILLDVPLDAHWEWQEHAAALLREYLLFRLDDDPEALDRHAAASQALTFLREQVPAPTVADDTRPGTSRAHAAALTAPEVVLHVPVPCVSLFEVVEDLVKRALLAAQEGGLLGVPARPEPIAQMSEWVCGQVTGQARGGRPVPWRAAS